MFSHFGKLADWIIDHRLLSLIVIVAITVVSAIGHYDPKILLGEPKAMPGQTTSAERQKNREIDRAAVPDVRPVQVSRGDVIIVAQSDHFFTPDGADAIRDAVQAVNDLPHLSLIHI